MIILCCDTATPYAVYSVGRDDGTVMASAAVHHHRDLSVRLFADIDGVLAMAGIGFHDIDILAAGIGPGSFTGVRIAVTTLRTLAQATGKRLVGVGTLSAYAEFLGARQAGNANDRTAVVAVLPSRRGEVYASVHRHGVEQRAPFAATFAELAMALKTLSADGDIQLCGPPGILPAEFDAYDFVPIAAPPAESLLRLAAAEVAANRFADPLGLNPLYVVAPAVNQHKDPRTAERLQGI